MNQEIYRAWLKAVVITRDSSKLGSCHLAVSGMLQMVAVMNTLCNNTIGDSILLQHMIGLPTKQCGELEQMTEKEMGWRLCMEKEDFGC